MAAGGALATRPWPRPSLSCRSGQSLPMAKTSSLRPHSRGVKKGSPKRTSRAASSSKSRKAPAKVLKKTARKAGRGKAMMPSKAGGAKGRMSKAKPAGSRREVAEGAAMPSQAVSVEAARRATARPRRSAAHKEETAAEHDHQDPRLSGVHGTGPEDSKVQTFNYGQFKTKTVARLDKPTNWFRRAAKPKQ